MLSHQGFLNRAMGNRIAFPDSSVDTSLAVDEAHHLRAEWWKTLKFVVENLDKPTIIALTATPPCDVSPFEWQRYEELCGEVDAEVSVPELVLSGDLCPHQDYVYFSVPSDTEQKVFSEFRAAVDSSSCLAAAGSFVVRFVSFCGLNSRLQNVGLSIPWWNSRVTAAFVRRWG